MIQDHSYLDFRYSPPLIEHGYGKNLRILKDPFTFTLLSRLSTRGVIQPEVGFLLEILYSHFTSVVASSEFPMKRAKISTRMSEFHPEGVFEGDVIDGETRVVVVSVARAGTHPAQICFDLLNRFLNPERVRQDFIFMNREVNGKGEVTGVRVSGWKTGGDMEGAYVLIPDPMGATGYSMREVIRIYRERVKGTPARFIAMNLIVTPEFVKEVTRHHPDALLYALRFDRGLSPEDLLGRLPGLSPDLERGLNEHQYIVPGAGGLGEVFNNAFET